MKLDLNPECMHSNKRRAIQHMDAKCPFTAPIQTRHPAPRGRCRARHGGPGCRAVTRGGEQPAFPPPAVLGDGRLCCVGLGSWKGWAVEGWQELGAARKAKLSAGATSPLPAQESKVAWGLWPP